MALYRDPDPLAQMEPGGLASVPPSVPLPEVPVPDAAPATGGGSPLIPGVGTAQAAEAPPQPPAPAEPTPLDPLTAEALGGVGTDPTAAFDPLTQEALGTGPSAPGAQETDPITNYGAGVMKLIAYAFNLPYDLVVDTAARVARVAGADIINPTTGLPWKPWDAGRALEEEFIRMGIPVRTWIE